MHHNEIVNDECVSRSFTFLWCKVCLAEKCGIWHRGSISKLNKKSKRRNPDDISVARFLKLKQPRSNNKHTHHIIRNSGRDGRDENLPHEKMRQIGSASKMYFFQRKVFECLCCR